MWRGIAWWSGTAAALLFVGAAAEAATTPLPLIATLDGEGPNYTLDDNDTAADGADDVVLQILDASTAITPSDYNGNWALEGQYLSGDDQTVWSGSASKPFSDLWVSDNKFGFYFEINENGKNSTRIEVERIQFSVRLGLDEHVLWEMGAGGAVMTGDQGIIFNPNEGSGNPDNTQNPLGTNADAGIFIPVRRVAQLSQALGQTITGSTELILRWRQDQSGASNEEWVTLNSGDFQFSSTDPIREEVPLPAALPLLGASLAGLAALRRRRR